MVLRAAIQAGGNLFQPRLARGRRGLGVAGGGGGPAGGSGGGVYPKRLGPGGVEVIAGARIAYGEDGLLEACDPHGCIRARLPPATLVHLEPVPGITRPQPLTGCIYVEFAEPYLHPGGRSTVWLHAPYEVAVTYRDTVVARVTPHPAKFTLVGDLVDGSVCRHYRSRVYSSHEEAAEERAEGLGLVRVDISGGPAVVPGLGFYAATLPLYTDSESRIYYPRVEAEVEGGMLNTKSTTEPPVKGLQVAQRGRRPLIFLLPSLAQPLR